MKIKAIDIFEYCLSALLIAALMMALILSRQDQSRRSCSKVEVTLSDTLRLISNEQIINRVRETYGECVGLRLDSIDLRAIEKSLGKCGPVLRSQVWTTPDGVMHIKVKQRTPVIRFQWPDAGAYADKSGVIFPANGPRSVRVPVVDGALPISLEKDAGDEVEDEQGRLWVRQMLSLAEYMRGTVWEENICQISVCNNGDLLLIPREGREVFVFGPPTGIASKFGRIEKYYTHILPENGRGYYGRVSVKYKGQIICNK